MKIVRLAALAAFLLQTLVVLGGPPTQEELVNVPGVSLSDIAENWLKYEGKLVKMKFDYRADTMPRINGTLTGTLWHYGRGWHTVQVKVPAEGEKWFAKLPAERRTTPKFVYGRLTGSGYSHTLELHGREIKTTARGPELIWQP